ncbi:MAG: hypothetical protein ACP5KE_08840 [Candidatus Methanodesulfokora sp.]|nr:MAG: hypothetical protein C0200_01835 [Candidatus Korarchaeota archaeon]
MLGWRITALILLLLLLSFLLVLSNYITPRCHLVTLLDYDSGRLIYSTCLNDGEAIVYKWKNSLFGLNVTEIFLVRNDSLVLSELIYEDPHGNYEPLVKSDDLDYLCHEGGPFHAVNISKVYKELIFMVGKVGKPKIIVNGDLIDLEREVGFGGRVLIKISDG